MDPVGPPAPPFPRADLHRARVLLSTGRHGAEESALAFALLGRLADYAELLLEQRSALRTVIRAIVVERDGRLCHQVGDNQLVPMRREVERAVRGALKAARPSAA